MGIREKLVKWLCCSRSFSHPSDASSDLHIFSGINVLSSESEFITCVFTRFESRVSLNFRFYFLDGKKSRFTVCEDRGGD